MWENFNPIIIGMLVLTILLFYGLMKIIMDESLSQIIGFLNSLTTKSLQPQKFYLIKNMKNMKKYVGISVLLIVIVALIMGGIIINDSRDYFKDVFEKQRNDLNLRSEASVDSLQIIIVNKTKHIDSLNVVESYNKKITNEKLILLESDNKKYRQQNYNLNNVIKHQNNMINNLKEK